MQVWRRRGFVWVWWGRNVGPSLSPPLYFFIWLHRVLAAARGLFHLRCVQDYFWLWHENS